MQKRILIQMAALAFVSLSSMPAQAQSMVAAFSGSAQVSVTASDTGPVEINEIDLPASNLSASDAGQLSDPFGSGSTFAYQNASGAAASATSVSGPLAPHMSVSASGSGEQAGVVPSSTTVGAIGGGAQD